MLWDVRKVKVEESLLGSFLVSIRIVNAELGDWWFSGVYGPNKTHQRWDFWDEIARL